MLNTENIEKNQPKAFEKLKKWMTDSVADMVKEPELLPVLLSNDIIDKALSWNLRSLYTFFDNNEVILSVCKDHNDRFYYFIGDEDRTSTYENRPLAEEAGFMECFKILESKL